MLPPPLQDHFFNPRNVGDLGNGAYCGRVGSPECGAVVQVSIRVDDSQTIREIKFRAAGCSVLVAATSMLTEVVKGTTTAAAARLMQQPEIIQSPVPEGF